MAVDAMACCVKCRGRVKVLDDPWTPLSRGDYQYDAILFCKGACTAKERRAEKRRERKRKRRKAKMNDAEWWRYINTSYEDDEPDWDARERVAREREEDERAGRDLHFWGSSSEGGGL